MPIDRSVKLNEQLKRVISTIIRDQYSINRLGLITVSRVIVSKDMQHARVFFTVLGDEEKEQKTLKKLTDDQSKLRHLLAQKIQLRFTPELIFEIDVELKNAMHIDSLIDQALETDKHLHDDNDVKNES